MAENEKREMAINVSVDRSAEIDALNKELAEKNLVIQRLAEKEFEAKKERLRLNGYDVSQLEMTEEGIQNLKNLEADMTKKSIGGSTAPLNAAQFGNDKNESDISSPDLDPEFWQFETQDAMFKALSNASQDPNNPQQKQAATVLAKLIKKSHKQGGVYELQGELTQLVKKPAPANCPENLKHLFQDPKKLPRFEKMREDE